MSTHRNPDGTYNGAAVLSELSGLEQDTVRGLWEAVKANHAKLDVCTRHEFRPVQPLSKLRQKYRCECCGGEVDSVAYRWYMLGLEHARGAQ